MKTKEEIIAKAKKLAQQRKRQRAIEKAAANRKPKGDGAVFSDEEIEAMEAASDRRVAGQ